MYSVIGKTVKDQAVDDDDDEEGDETKNVVYKMFS